MKCSTPVRHEQQQQKGVLATRRRRQRERQKSNRFCNQNNNSARALHFLVYFVAVTARLGREISLWHVLWRT